MEAVPKDQQFRVDAVPVAAVPPVPSRARLKCPALAVRRVDVDAPGTGPRVRFAGDPRSPVSLELYGAMGERIGAGQTIFSADRTTRVEVRSFERRLASGPYSIRWRSADGRSSSMRVVLLPRAGVRD